MAPSRGYGVCKALFVTKDRRGQEKEKKKRGEGLRVFQEPLEEGDAVKFSARLQCLLYGLGLTACLTLLTVAQQRVQQLSHLPLPLPKSLDHCWELKEHTVITH